MDTRELNPATIPPDPLNQWSNDYLKRQWAEMWKTHNEFGLGGSTRAIALNAIHDELVERGIDPAEPLQQRGFNVQSVEIPA